MCKDCAKGVSKSSFDKESPMHALIFETTSCVIGSSCTCPASGSPPESQIIQDGPCPSVGITPILRTEDTHWSLEDERQAGYTPPMADSNSRPCGALSGNSPVFHLRGFSPSMMILPSLLSTLTSRVFTTSNVGGYSETQLLRASLIPSF